MEVLAEADGVLTEIVKNEGDTVLSGELLGKLEAGAAAAAAPAQAAAPAPAAAAPAAAASAGGEEPIRPRRPASWPKRTVLIRTASAVPARTVA